MADAPSTLEIAFAELIQGLVADEVERALQRRIEEIRGPQWVSKGEACKLLGGISLRTLARFISLSRLETSRIGGRLLVSRDSIDWLIEEAREPGAWNKSPWLRPVRLPEVPKARWEPAKSTRHVEAAKRGYASWKAKQEKMDP
ncbi:MAG: hypothetical protein QM778_33310 [Myxococcales bacterium]